MSNVSKFVAVATVLGHCVEDRTNRMVPGNLRCIVSLLRIRIGEKKAEITSKWLHFEFEILLYYTYTKYQVYRKVAIPRPLIAENTATVYDFQKDYFVVSPRQEFFETGWNCVSQMPPYR